MKEIFYSNVHGMPPSVIDAFARQAQNYNSGRSDITTTQLMIPAREFAIKKAESDKHVHVSVEAALWRTLGSFVHEKIEPVSPSRALANYGTEKPHEYYRARVAEGAIELPPESPALQYWYQEMAEDRFYHTFIIDEKPVILGGQFDLIHTHAPDEWTMTDGKATSIYQHQPLGINTVDRNPDGTIETEGKYIIQSIANVWLARKNGVNVTRSNLLAMYKDASVRLMKQMGINTQFFVHGFPIPEDNTAEEIILSLIAPRMRAYWNALDNGQYPMCSTADRWGHRHFAVMKPAAKKAVKLYKAGTNAADQYPLTPQGIAQAGMDAEEHAERIGGYVEKRFELWKRCEENYCPVAQHCSQFKNAVDRE